MTRDESLIKDLRDHANLVDYDYPCSAEYMNEAASLIERITGPKSLSADSEISKRLRNLAGTIVRSGFTGNVSILMEAADRLEAALRHPQDMSLRELFDHVAIVNDAVRAALASHPGCEPVRREVEG